MPALDFAAAAPWTYDHWVGGGTWEDKTIGRGNDVVESLQGGDFKSGQLVSYFLEIDTAFLPEQKNDQAIQVELGFLASTTGQSGVGQDWVQNIQVNYNSERVTYDGDGSPATKTGPGQYEDNNILTRTPLADTANQGANNDGGSYVEFVEQRFESRDGTVKLGNDSQPAISTDLGPLSNISYGGASTSGNPWLYDEQMVR